MTEHLCCVLDEMTRCHGCRKKVCVDCYWESGKKLTTAKTDLDGVMVAEVVFICDECNETGRFA